MKAKKLIAMILVFFMVVPLFSMGPLTVHAEEMGARAEYGGLNGTELFLGGKYIELGISNWGDFGTEGSKPANFQGTSKRNNLGMSADHDGYGVGLDLPVDYYLPGTPEERFAVGYKVDGQTNAQSNTATNGSKQMPTTVLNTSMLDKGRLGATIISTWADTMEIKQIISFQANDKFYRNEVTITNLTENTWDGARYMRTMDPDNTKDQGGEYLTANTVTHTIEEDGAAVVEAKTIANDDPLYVAFGSRAPIFFYSSNPRAKASVFGFDNSNPYESAAYDTPRHKNDTLNDDAGITLTWDSGSLAPGESKSFTYYTSLDERDFDEVIGDIELDEGGSTDLTEAEANDGTVVGNQKVNILGAKLIDSIDVNHIRMNNLPSGLGFEVTRLSDTELDFKLIDKAAKHNKEFSIDNLSVTVGKDNLIGHSSDLTTSTFSLTFRDPAMISLNKGVVTEASYDDGQINEKLLVSLTNGKFATDIVTEDIQVHHLSDGLSPSLTRISDQELEIIFVGTATVKDDVEDAFISVAANKLIGSTSDLISQTFKIDFLEKEPYIFVQSLVYESDLNNGSIDDKLILKLANGTLDTTVTESVYTKSWPDGLEIGEITFDSPTQITVSIAGQASSHEYTNSINNAQIVIGDIQSNTFSILFRSPPPSITATPDIFPDAGNGSIAETLRITLNNGKFTEEVNTGVTINNLPEGMGFSVVRINDTQLEVHFTGQATSKNEASQFASVTVDSEIVIDALSPITSNNFDLQVPEDASLVLMDETNLTWDMIREENIKQESVTSDVYLPTNGTYGSTINWTSTNETVIASNGTVIRPLFGEGDQEVTLTATIANGTSTLTKNFTLIVKMVVTDEQAVAEDADQLTWNTIREKNITQDQVTSNLVLPSEGEYDSTITWTTSNAAVIGTDGTVTRPNYADGDQIITLIATITKGDVTTTKQFELTVKALQENINEQLDEVIGRLNIGYAEEDSAESVTKHIELISEGFYGSEVIWVSHRSNIVSNTGEVQRPLKDTIVRLTARVTKEGFFREKDFYITVKGTSLVDLPQDELGAAIVYAPGDSESSVKKNVFLTTVGDTGSVITWTSSSPDIISNTGRVNRPGPDEEDVNVELTVKLIDPNNASEFRTKTFILTVKKLSDQEAVDEAARTLGIKDAATFVTGDIWESVTEEFLLLQTGKYGTDITWTSDQSSVISIVQDGLETTGNVKRQENETKVILTATFSRNDKIATKQYLLVVKAIGMSKDGAIRQPTSRQADLSVNNDGNPLQQGITILRTGMSNGTSIDTIIVDDNDMYELVEAINPNDPDVANRRVVIRHVDDPAVHADEIAIEIPATAVSTLAGRNTSLDIITDLATIHLDEASIRQLEAAGTDLYFRIVPVKDSDVKGTFQNRAVRKGSVKLSLASNKTVKVLGMPREIETNYSGVNTNIRIPLSEFVDQIPAQSSGERDAFLDNLRIYVEHSDGEISVYAPIKIVYTAEGEPNSVEFQIAKFSTFQIIQITDKKASDSQSDIPIDIKEPVIVGSTVLTGEKIKELQNEDGDIIIETDRGTFNLNAGSVDVDGLRKQFDKEDINLKDIVIHVNVTEADQSDMEGFKLAAEGRQVQPVGQLIQFNIEATYEGQTRSVASQGWQEYTLPVPAGMKITTGVLYKDGEIYHQPTYVTIENGRYYARINSLENGMFGLIWNPQEFSDVADHWSKSDVNDMGSRLVVSGVNDSVFEPQRAITRSEFTAMIVRALGIVNYDAQNVSFSDVAANVWYEREMNVAIEYGLIFGYPDGTFRPNNSISRQEAMAIVSRAMVITELINSRNEEQTLQLLQSFKDSETIAKWAVDDVKINLSAGIIVGRNERLAPNENITRAEAATAIRRLLIESTLINP